MSAGRGAQPRWRRDGNELFYLDGDGTLMAVAVSLAGVQLAFGTPTPLFKTRLDAVRPKSALLFLQVNLIE